MTDTEIVKLIRRGEHAGALDILYQNYPAFKNTLKKAGGNTSNAEDIFQDALLVLLQKLSDAKFSLSCSLNSYLFGICRNLSYEYFRKQGRTIHLPLGEHDHSNEAGDMERFIEEEQKYETLDKILSTIGRKCMELLSLFYLKNLSMAAVATQLGFKSENSAKTQKYKCLERARKMAEDLVFESNTTLS